MSLFDTLGAGLSGLKVASAGLATTTHNVTNASTVGFTRRKLATSTADPVRRGLVWLGSGAKLDAIHRSADPFALGRLVASTGTAAATEAEHASLAAYEGLFEPSGGPSLRQSVDAMFDTLQAATTDPSDLALRRDVVEAADTFALTARNIASGLEGGISDTDAAIGVQIDQVNADLATVANLNQQLARAGGALSAGDLADQRDQAVQRLAETIGASVHIERDGSATVRIGGHAAVSGQTARTVGVRDDGAGPVITLSVDEGTVVVTPDGGAIGGELDARETLSGWLSDLDTLVTDLATSVNAAQAGGFTLSGAAGGPLFDLPASGSAASGLRVDAALIADPGALAFAASPTALAGDGGNLTVLIGLESAATVAGTTAGAFATNLVSRVGTETSLAASRADLAESTRFDAEELYANLTGVDLDEEAVNLVEYQAAYQAAAKVIETTDATLDALMSIGR